MRMKNDKISPMWNSRLFQESSSFVMEHFQVINSKVRADAVCEWLTIWFSWVFHAVILWGYLHPWPWGAMCGRQTCFFLPLHFLGMLAQRYKWNCGLDQSMQNSVLNANQLVNTADILEERKIWCNVYFGIKMHSGLLRRFEAERCKGSNSISIGGKPWKLMGQE